MTLARIDQGTMWHGSSMTQRIGYCASKTAQQGQRSFAITALEHSRGCLRRVWGNRSRWTGGQVGRAKHQRWSISWDPRSRSCQGCQMPSQGPQNAMHRGQTTLTGGVLAAPMSDRPAASVVWSGGSNSSRARRSGSPMYPLRRRRTAEPSGLHGMAKCDQDGYDHGHVNRLYYALSNLVLCGHITAEVVD